MTLHHSLVPLLALAVLAGANTLEQGWPTASLVVLCLVLMLSVLSAVHHAEVVAHRTGEPLGTLVLALAVTIIEVALILSFMLVGDSGTASLARDTLFAAIMIICNGVVGLSLLVAGTTRNRCFVFKASALRWPR
jgi:Ca2+:H+ antiporter